MMGVGDTGKGGGVGTLASKQNAKIINLNIISQEKGPSCCYLLNVYCNVSSFSVLNPHPLSL